MPLNSLVMRLMEMPYDSMESRATAGPYEPWSKLLT